MECVPPVHAMYNPFQNWEGDCDDEDYDPSFLLPVVVPITDEYEDWSVDLETWSSSDDNECVYEGENIPSNAKGDECRDVSSGAVDTFDRANMTEELLQYHNELIHRVATMGVNQVESDALESEEEEAPLGAHFPAGHGRSESCPKLPRPRLWTLEERGESTASNAGAFNEFQSNGMTIQQVNDFADCQFHMIGANQPPETGRSVFNKAMARRGNTLRSHQRSFSDSVPVFPVQRRTSSSASTSSLARPHLRRNKTAPEQGATPAATLATPHVPSSVRRAAQQADDQGSVSTLSDLSNVSDFGEDRRYSLQVSRTRRKFKLWQRRKGTF